MQWQKKHREKQVQPIYKPILPESDQICIERPVFRNDWNGISSVKHNTTDEAPLGSC